MKYKPKSTGFWRKERDGKNLGALRGFFKWGENYVPHLSRKEKILARVLEKRTKKDSKD
jgi:hypothetical protein